MRNPISILIALAFVVGGAMRVDLLRQTPSGQSIEHEHANDHHMGSHSDQGYQHSFGQAEMWAKEFDDPARDAWQKPNEVLDAGADIPRGRSWRRYWIFQRADCQACARRKTVCRRYRTRHATVSSCACASRTSGRDRSDTC